MEEYLNRYLLKQNLIKLNNLKMVEGDQKKLISSCIFIPEEPKITDKVFNYFTGLIKSIETFNINFSKQWIYRLYVDDLFFSGLKKIDDRMHYDYNNVSDSNNNNHTFIPPEKLYRKTVKKGIKKNKDNLKKIQNLMHTYLQNIINNIDGKYDNIEIVSFRCNKVKFTGKYPGHANTFGSIIRFFPIFDSNVDMFVSVNSRYPITPMMGMIIKDWYSRKNKKILSYTYDAKHFIKKCMEQSLDKYIRSLKDGWEKPHTKLFKEVIEGIFEMKQELCPLKTQLSIKDMTIAKLKKLLYSSGDQYEFDKYISIAAGFFGMKRDNELFEKKIELFSKLLRFLILEKDKFIFGIDELILKLTLSLESGTMLMFNEIPNHSINFKNSDKLKYQQLTNSEILAKLDDNKKEYFRKIEGRIQDVTLNELEKLNPNVDQDDISETFNLLVDLGRTYINYYYHISNNIYNELSPQFIYKPDFMGLRNSYNKPLILTEKLHENFISLLDGNLYDIGVYNSRSLYRLKEKSSFIDKDELFKVYYDSDEDLQTIDIDLGLLLSNYFEYRKLFLYDSNDRYSNLKILFKFFDEKYFVPLDINNYSLDNINCLLKVIIDHSRKDNMSYQLNKIKKQTGSGKIQTKKNINKIYKKSKKKTY